MTNTFTNVIPGFPTMVGHLQSVKITVRYIKPRSTILAKTDKVIPSGLLLYPYFFSLE
jgi:hypothetical protein